jgi:hypothetical protein
LGLLSDISGDQTQRKQFSSASKIIFKEELIFHDRLADFWIITSQASLRIVYLEAMADEIPVLLGDNPGLNSLS